MTPPPACRLGVPTLREPENLAIKHLELICLMRNNRLAYHAPKLELFKLPYTYIKKSDLRESLSK
jgi:hypothetical protein